MTNGAYSDGITPGIHKDGEKPVEAVEGDQALYTGAAKPFDAASCITDTVL